MIVELVDPPEGVTGFGEKFTFTPEGCPLAVKLTEEEYWLIEYIVTVAEAVLPALTLTLEGDTLIPKSPGAAPVMSKARPKFFTCSPLVPSSFIR